MKIQFADLFFCCCGRYGKRKVTASEERASCTLFEMWRGEKKEKKKVEIRPARG